MTTDQSFEGTFEPPMIGGSLTKPTDKNNGGARADLVIVAGMGRTRRRDSPGLMHAELLLLR